MCNDLLKLDLTKLEDIGKKDINNCILYHSGKDVAFGSDKGYYDVPVRLFSIIKPVILNIRDKKEKEKLGIESIWEEKEDGGFEIKDAFLKH